MHRFIGHLMIVLMGSFTLGWQSEVLYSEFIQLSTVFSAFF